MQLFSVSLQVVFENCSFNRRWTVSRQHTFIIYFKISVLLKDFQDPFGLFELRGWSVDNARKSLDPKYPGKATSLTLSVFVFASLISSVFVPVGSSRWRRVRQSEFCINVGSSTKTYAFGCSLTYFSWGIKTESWALILINNKNMGDWFLRKAYCIRLKNLYSPPIWCPSSIQYPQFFIARYHFVYF